MKALERTVEEIAEKTALIDDIKAEYESRTQASTQEIGTLKSSLQKNEETISHLNKEVLKNESKERDRLLKQFYYDSIREWRNKSWKEFSFFTILAVVSTLYFFHKSGWNLFKAEEMAVDLQAKLLFGLVLSITLYFFDIVSFKYLISKYRNHSNIENFKKGLEIPENLKE